MKQFLACLLVIMLGVPNVVQAAPSADDTKQDTQAASAADEDAEDDEEASAPEQAPQTKKRDTITLKSGVVLTDVKIVSKSPKGYEVSVADGVTIEIPRKQVVDIEYEVEKPAPEPEETADPLGEGLSEQLKSKLSNPLTVALSGQPEDFVSLFAELSESSGVTITVTEAVKALPEEERAWTIEAKPELSLKALLMDDFLPKFPKLTVSPKEDALIVDLKKDTGEAPAKTATPPEAPAAPAAP